ncbi:MAG: helix-turn-helix transcriptional regulator [Pseudomonadota bacterium]|nr:helix-turn-helix transcriptional regulator [Pseudomonadota bacterium]
MHLETSGVMRTPSITGQYNNSIAFARLQSAIEMDRPCIIVSPPGFGQQQIIHQVAQALGRSCCKVKFKDQALVDPSAIREAIATAQNLSAKEAKKPGQHKAILIIEHDFNPQSLDTLQELEQSYADAIGLNRLHAVLPILCTPLSHQAFDTPKLESNAHSSPEWLVVQAHELYVQIPLGTQQLLNSAPPHLHQSLLGITRLAESWPEMGSLLNAKLKGLAAQQETLKNDNLENQDLQIPAQALKTACSELLNNYQGLMSSLGEQLLTQPEQILLAHLSLYPPNIYPFLPMIKGDLPHVDVMIHELCLKNILVNREEEGPQGKQKLLSFSNLAWRFFAQGHLRRTCSANDLNAYVNDMLDTIKAEIQAHTDDLAQKEYYRTLAIELGLSARHYEDALELIIEQAQTQETTNRSKLARIEQAVNWFKFIPQRLINQNPQARVIQSYHRLVVDTASAEKQNINNAFNTKQNSNEEGNNLLLKRIRYTLSQGQTGQQSLPQTEIHHPRVLPHESMEDATPVEQGVPVSLKQVEVPKQTYKPTQASLLLDIQQHIESSNMAQISTLSQNMIEQALNQQKPELFLHGIAYLWYQTQICTGTIEFKSLIGKVLSDERLSTQLNEFRYWLNQIYTALDSIKSEDNKTPEISLPGSQHLSSLGQNLLGFMTSYFNSVIALSHCDSPQVTDRLQEATYYAMNLPDTFSQTLMPLWLIETFNFFQQNRLQQAVTFISNASRNNTMGSQRILNPLFKAFENFAQQVQNQEIQENSLDQLDKSMDQVLFLAKQLEAQALLWQHQYKKSNKQLAKFFKLKNAKDKNNNQHIPWVWFGPSSWYLLENHKDESDTKTPKNSNLELQLNEIEHFYANSHEFDPAFLDLSKRESEILGLVVEGCSNEEISNLLCRSLGTIKLHVHSIYKKLKVSNRVNAIKKCHTSGFFSFGL